MSIAWIVGSRYSGVGMLRSGKTFLSFISITSLLGMALGVVALVVVVSVMNGFDKELKRRILGVVPHVVVDARQLPSVIQDDVMASAAYLERSALIVNGSESHLVSLNGIDPARERDISLVPENMIVGRIENLDAQGLVLGAPLAYRVGVSVGDLVTLVIPDPSVNGNSVRPIILQRRVVGTFELDAEPDYHLALVEVESLRQAMGVPNSKLRLRLYNVFDAAGVAGKARTAGFDATDWTSQYGDFFRTVRMEKIMMFLLLTLIIAIAAFNIISSLTMMVKNKQGDIAVLRSMGVSPTQVLLIFMTQGAVIGLLGVAIGITLGIPLAMNIAAIVGFFEQLFGGRMLAGTYFDVLPTDVRLADVAAIALISSLIALLSSLYPAWQASRLAPAAVLKHE